MAVERPARFWPEGWWRLVDLKIGIIPLPIYLVLAVLLAVLVQEGEIKPDGPTMTQKCPSGTSNETPFTASTPPT